MRDIEIIARMEYRGKLKKALLFATLQSSHPPERGKDIYREQNPCGKIVDYAQVGYNQYYLLVIMPETEGSESPVSLDPEQLFILQKLKRV